MSWSGTMWCQVHNGTGVQIDGVKVSHQWAEFTQSKDFDFIPAGHTVDAFGMNVGSGGSDFWSVRFADNNKNCYYRSNKQCNVEESDYQSRNPVVLDLGPGSQGFSVVLPTTSSCLNNSYNRC
jgi:hypothetical protein